MLGQPCHQSNNWGNDCAVAIIWSVFLKCHCVLSKSSSMFQFVKGKGFLVCDVRVAAHTQNCPKKMVR